MPSPYRLVDDRVDAAGRTALRGRRQGGQAGRGRGLVLEAQGALVRRTAHRPPQGGRYDQRLGRHARRGEGRPAGQGRPAPPRRTRPHQRRSHARDPPPWWVDEELAQRVADGVNTETTRRQYADRVRFQIAPLLRGVRLRDFSAMHIRQWQATLGQQDASPSLRRRSLAILARGRLPLGSVSPQSSGASRYLRSDVRTSAWRGRAHRRERCL